MAKRGGKGLVQGGWGLDVGLMRSKTMMMVVVVVMVAVVVVVYMVWLFTCSDWQAWRSCEGTCPFGRGSLLSTSWGQSCPGLEWSRRVGNPTLLPPGGRSRRAPARMWDSVESRDVERSAKCSRKDGNETEKKHWDVTQPLKVPHRSLTINKKILAAEHWNKERCPQQIMLIPWSFKKIISFTCFSPTLRSAQWYLWNIFPGEAVYSFCSLLTLFSPTTCLRQPQIHLTISLSSFGLPSTSLHLFSLSHVSSL